MSENNVNKIQGKRVLIFQQRGWGFRIGHFLAKKLQDQGCHLAAFTMKRSVHKFVLNQKDVHYDLVINYDEVMADPKKYLGDSHYTLAQICQDLGVPSVWPMASSVRNHFRCYGDKYYYSFRQNVSDEEIIDYIKAVYKYVKIFFDEFKPDVILAPNFVESPHITCSILAKKRGVKMLVPYDCKIRNIKIFTQDYLESSGSFDDQLNALNRGLAESKNMQVARQYIREFRESFKRPDYMDRIYKKTPLLKKIRQEFSPYRQILRWYLKRPDTLLGNVSISTDYRPPRIILRDHYAHRRYRKITNNFNYYPFDQVKKFAYLPLQFQPEETTDVQAPYFNNQIDVARLSALSLPDDYTLVVKEHPMMVGYRPPSYFEKIARTPNVKLIDYRIPSDQVLRRADLIISPNSTVVAEAAFYNKPAIQFGNLGITLNLPNTFKHTDFTTLSAKIKEVLAVDLHTAEYESRLENYVAAAYDAGFIFNYWGVWERNEKEDMEVLWQAYQNEFNKVLS